MRKIIFIILLTLGSVTQAQNLSEIQQVYTPNTYAFARYGDLPVDYSSGIPQINIPLTSISDKDINVDVSLSYYASGIKVDQEASWAGLGWSLNAGGVITSQVRGIPDYMNSTNKLPRLKIRFHSNVSESIDDYIRSEENTLREASALCLTCDDTAPDIFYFNFCGRTGQFYLDENGNGCMLNQEDILIKFNSNSIFEITDDKGVVYLFSDKEQAYSDVWRGSYTTGWYLSSITSPTGGKITFSYSPGGTLATGNLQRYYSACYMPINKDVSVHTIPPTYRTPSFKNSSSMSGIVLNRITASSGAYIEFVCKNEKRKDSKDIKGSILERITAYSSTGTAYKKYILSYGYFEPDSQHRLSSTHSYAFLNYRLRLNSVQELATTGNTTLPPYSFSYYGDGGSVTNNIYTLPYRLSPCQDHWGYYNYTDNATIFANNSEYNEFHRDPWLVQLSNTGAVGVLKGFKVDGGGDRRMSTEASKACTLKKITYPTRGYMELDFESHNVNYSLGQIGIGGIRIKQIVDNDGKGNQKIRDYQYASYTWEDGKCEMETNLYHILYYQFVYENNTGQSADLLMAYGVPPEFANSANVLQINSCPAITLGVATDFIYPKVTEHIRGQGRTEFTYTDYANQTIPNLDGLPTPDFFNSGYVYKRSGLIPSNYFNGPRSNSCIFPFMNQPNLGWKRGQLASRKVYTESNEALVADYMIYEERALNTTPGYKVVCINDYEYIFSCDYVFGGVSRLTKEIHEIYGENRTFSTTKEYIYDAGYLKHPSEVKETDSDGKFVVTQYHYPNAYGTLFSSLVNDNMILPVDIRSYKNNRLISCEQVDYNTYGQPITSRRAEGIAANTAFNPSQVSSFTPYLWRTYNNDHLLISEKTRKNDLDYAYLWAYGKQHPVAKIEGATYSKVLEWMGNSFINELAVATANAPTLLTTLRNKLSTYSVLLTTYTYLPQVGMTSIIMPNGEKTTYEYDSFNRLSFVKDHNGKIVEQYDYNYKD